MELHTFIIILLYHIVSCDPFEFFYMDTFSGYIYYGNLFSAKIFSTMIILICFYAVFSHLTPNKTEKPTIKLLPPYYDNICLFVISDAIAAVITCL